MKVDIKVSGVERVRTLLGGVAAAGKAASGPIISLSSRKPYARYIEEGVRGDGRRRRAGPARMFADGIAAVRPKIGPTLGKAILGGPTGVAKAKADLNRQAVEEVRKRTPVRSGALRASVSAAERPGIG